MHCHNNLLPITWQPNGGVVGWDSSTIGYKQYNVVQAVAKTPGHARAGLKTFGLVHEHKSVTFFTSRVRCQNVPKKHAPKINMVAPITMAATPADHAGGGGRAVAVSSTGTTTAEVSAGHRFPRSF